MTKQTGLVIGYIGLTLWVTYAFELFLTNNHQPSPLMHLAVIYTLCLGAHGLWEDIRR